MLGYTVVFNLWTFPGYINYGYIKFVEYIKLWVSFLCFIFPIS